MIILFVTIALFGFLISVIISMLITIFIVLVMIFIIHIDSATIIHCHLHERLVYV